jgi:predicted transposase/invertase (TIGR01784 family)
MHRLNPLNDYAFKRIMEEKEGLISFLNAVLDADDKKKLISLEIIDNKELTMEMITDKTGRLDVRAKTADGMQLDIEVQLTNQNNMDKRTMFLLGKLFLEGIKKGEDYINLSKVITINILDFEYLDIEKFHSKYHLWEDEEKDYLLTDLIEIHFIEMPKFRRLTQKDIIGNALHRWLKFFDKKLPEEELKELMEMDSAIKRAEAKLEFLGSDKKSLELYQAREDSLHEKANLISTGRMEGKLEVAKEMLSAGLDMQAISNFTKIPMEELKRLLKLQ